MKTAIGLVLLIGVSTLFLTAPRINAQAEEVVAQGGSEAENLVTLTRVYVLDGLPVWSKDGEFQPVMLSRLIRAAVEPTKWEPVGGNCTMAPYPQKHALIVSADPKTHDGIVDLLESLRANSKSN